MEKVNMSKTPLLQSFRNKFVSVQVSNSKIIRGVLVGFEETKNPNHLPQLLVVENCFGFHIIRGEFIKIVLDG